MLGIGAKQDADESQSEACRPSGESEDSARSQSERLRSQVRRPSNGLTKRRPDRQEAPAAVPAAIAIASEREVGMPDRLQAAGP